MHLSRAKVDSLGGSNREFIVVVNEDIMENHVV